MKAKDRNGDPVPFDIKYVSGSSGRVVQLKRAVLARNVKNLQAEVSKSANPLPPALKAKGSINIKMNVMAGEEVLGLSTRNIIEFNGQEVVY